MKKLLICVIFFLIPVSIHAKVTQLEDGVVLISGDIFSKDADNIEKIDNIDYLLLDSIGGSFNSAIRISETILKKHPHTNVLVIDKCYSACTIILFSAPLDNRSMEKNATLQIHNVSVDFQSRTVSTKVVTPVMNEVARASAFIALMYNNVGIPQPVIIKGMSRFQEDTLKITAQELLEWGSISKIVE